MNKSRREFIKTGGFSVLGLIGASGAAANIVQGKAFSPAAADALGAQNALSFKRLIGTEFTIYGNDFAAPARLSEVKILKPARAGKALTTRATRQTTPECFQLVFDAGSAPTAAQDVYQLFHPQIGQFDLLLVPGQTLKNTPTLVAVINRI